MLVRAGRPVGSGPHTLRSAHAADPHPALAGLSDRQPHRRGRAAAARRLRRGRARARVRHAGVHRRRGRPARPRADVRRGVPRAHEDFDVLFASKAFPCTAVYRVLAEEGIACDVASGGELALALRGGFDPARIYMHGNAKSLDELRQARAAGVGHIVIDNADEIERLEAVVGDGPPQPVLLRVAPDVRGKTHDKISTGQADTKFGFSMADAPAAIARASESEALDLVGLHIHIGSQILELDPFRRAIEAIATLGDFGTYNLGGGLGVAYTAEQEPPRIGDYVAAKVDAADARVRAGQAAARGARPRARRELDGDALHRAERQAQRLDVGRGRRRHVRQPAPDALRRGLRGADRRPLRRRHAVAADRQALRVRRRHRPRRRARRPARRRRHRHARRPAPTATRWPTTTTACRARRSCSSRAATRASSCGARRTTTSPRAMSERASRSACSATARSAARSRRCWASAPSTSPRSPACIRRSAAS